MMILVLLVFEPEISSVICKRCALGRHSRSGLITSSQCGNVGAIGSARIGLYFVHV